MMKAAFKGKVLPEMHPDHVRVTNILNRVVEVTTDSGNDLNWRLFMERMKWEVLVVEDHAAYACCLPGGKIVVFTGLFKHLTTDDEIAIIICHEVAHGMMRHVKERMNLWHAFMRQFFYMVVRPNIDPREVFCMTDVPFPPRMESGAYYIGMLLFVAAGYDPRVAPKVFEEMDPVSAFHDYVTLHPGGKLRSKMLSEDFKDLSIDEGAEGGEVDN
ncbi:hypothetical protein M8C21_024246 [Ambrosia artemisiifolia]|uniref:Peptidase M48 domain-containing protein n=1 Tax=Ambrosia artemisiifolia TaxID=4212 RepID=A0AAD5D299_AMBAR|nr:hypothetical protein M8C21_024246 [Ambrosia artemisiifolia]